MDDQDRKSVVLIIVDGFGIAAKNDANAITLANTPTWDMLTSTYPNKAVHASGNHVGLPKGIMGNSEVGHLTIGTGRITFQSLERVNQAIKNDMLRDNETVMKLINHVKQTQGDLHLMGLLSDGKVHSDQLHLYALIDLFKDAAKKIWIHGFTDGRDTPPDSSPKYIQGLLDYISDLDHANLASIIGRYYAMDRDKKWDRTKFAYDALVYRIGEETSDIISTVRERITGGETDEFLRPVLTTDGDKIKDGDAVLFFNFRTDRPRQLTQAINYDVDFPTKSFENLLYATMTQYDEDFDVPVIFEPQIIENSLAEVVSRSSLKQIHIAETEKYAHVTFFLNGGVEDPFPLEERILVPSPKIPTYDMQPEMSTPGITRETVKAIQSSDYDLIVLNIACPDMVGHTGDLDATIVAVEAMDQAFAEIYESAKQNDYVLMITADHGNAEKMRDGSNIHTAHTTNKVPFLITIDEVSLIDNGGLKNVASTVLEVLGVDKSSDMSESMIIK